MVDATREKLVDDVSTVIADSEQLLKEIASASAEKAQSLRGDLGRKLKDARERLGKLEEEALASARAAAKKTDEYVHENPWQSIAVVAAVAAILGIVVGLLLNRR